LKDEVPVVDLKPLTKQDILDKRYKASFITKISISPYYALFILSPTNATRRFCHRAIHSKYFEPMILVFIVLGSALFAFEGEPQHA